MMPDGGRAQTGGGKRGLPLISRADRPRRFSAHVFICGLHRSGTTLLENLLHDRCEVSVLRAPVPENEGQHLQDVYPAAREHGGTGRFAFSPQMHPAPPGPADAAAAHEGLLRCWTPWVEGAAPVLVEKSPPNLTRIGWLRAVFPGARFVVLTRDPRVVAAASMKWAKSTIPELVYHWHVAHCLARSDWSADCVHVRYEDLCADPDAVLERCSTDLGLKRRPVALEPAGRFGAVESSNAAYLAALPALEYGEGSWQGFGYDLTSG